MSVERQEERSRGLQTAATAAVSSAGLLCPRCNTAVKAGKKFCSQCGSPVGVPAVTAQRASHRPRAARFTLCPECGFENHHSDRFCKGCGGLLIASPAQIRRYNETGSHSNGSKGTAPTGLESAPDLKPVVLPASLEAAAVREAVAGLDAIIAPAQNSKSEVETPAPRPVEIPITSGTTVPGAVPAPAVAQNETEAAQVATAAQTPVLPATLQADRPSAKPRLARARGVGLGAAALIVLAVLIIFSTRHYASKRLRQSTVVASAPSPAPASANVVDGAAPAGAERRSDLPSRSNVPSHEKITAGRNREHSEAVTRAHVAATDPPSEPAPPPGIIIAKLDLTPKASTSSVGAPQPPALEVPSNASAAPPLAAANLPPAPQPDRSAQPTISATVAALPPSVLSSAETNAVRVMNLAANAPSPRVGGVVQPAKLLAHPSPLYPAGAGDRRLEGTVHVIATVRKDGTVGNARVASGDVTLASAALHAVRQWRFRPALLNGQAVQSETNIEITFHLAN